LRELCASTPKLKKKPAQNISVAGFTIRSLIPVVTNWGYQFIASTHLAA